MPEKTKLRPTDKDLVIAPGGPRRRESVHAVEAGESVFVQPGYGKHGWEDPGWGRDDASQISILAAVHALADQISDTELRRQVKKLSSEGLAKVANRIAGVR